MFHGFASSLESCTSSDNATFRKARAAITGGAMVGVGLVLIPLPVPLGVVTAGAGLTVLSKEFTTAQRVQDTIKEAWNKNIKDIEYTASAKRILQGAMGAGAGVVPSWCKSSDANQSKKQQEEPGDGDENDDTETEDETETVEDDDTETEELETDEEVEPEEEEKEEKSP